MKIFSYRANLKMAAIWEKVRVRKKTKPNFLRLVIYINLDNITYECLLNTKHFACGNQVHPHGSPMR